MMELSNPGVDVCFVISALGIGGAEKQLAAYLSHRPAGLKVHVIYLNDHFDESRASLKEHFQSLGVSVEYVPLKRGSVFGLLRLAKSMRHLRPRVVHTFLAGSPDTWGRLAALLAGISSIVHSDRSLCPPVSRIQRLFRPWLDRRTSLFLPNANAIARWLTLTGVPLEKIVVVENGVDLERFQPTTVSSERAKWGICEQAVIAGFLGKFRPEKRLDLLLDSLMLMPVNQRPDHLVLGGDGPELAVIKERIASDPWMKDHVRAIGLIQDVPAFMQSIDYLVLSSDREGFPNVILEAMAMAKPVVATEVAEIPQIIEGVGIVAPAGDSVRFAEAWAQMNRLSKDERAQLGERGRKRVLHQWEIRAAARRFWCSQDRVINKS